MYYIDNEGRECTQCKTYKEWSEFNKNSSGTNGYKPLCKQCQRSYDKSYKRDMNKHAEATKRYRLKNIEKFRELARQRYHEDVEANRARSKQYYWNKKAKQQGQ